MCRGLSENKMDTHFFSLLRSHSNQSVCWARNPPRASPPETASLPRVGESGKATFVLGLHTVGTSRRHFSLPKLAYSLPTLRIWPVLTPPLPPKLLACLTGSVFTLPSKK